jgi:hypothetical protein
VECADARLDRPPAPPVRQPIDDAFEETSP